MAAAILQHHLHKFQVMDINVNEYQVNCTLKWHMHTHTHGDAKATKTSYLFRMLFGRRLGQRLQVRDSQMHFCYVCLPACSPLSWQFYFYFLRHHFNKINCSTAGEPSWRRTLFSGYKKKTMCKCRMDSCIVVVARICINWMHLFVH